MLLGLERVLLARAWLLRSHPSDGGLGICKIVTSFGAVCLLDADSSALARAAPSES